VFQPIFGACFSPGFRQAVGLFGMYLRPCVEDFEHILKLLSLRESRRGTPRIGGVEAWKRRQGKGKERKGKGREGKGREGKGREGKEREGKEGRREEGKAGRKKGGKDERRE
jgi:hypothetical protein